MRRIPIFWNDRDVGTIAVPDSFRPPIAQADLDRIPTGLFVRSRSAIYDVRPGDVRLELRGAGRDEEVVAISTPRLGPGDVGCIDGFEPAAGCEDFAPDQDMIELGARFMQSNKWRV